MGNTKKSIKVNKLSAKKTKQVLETHNPSLIEDRSEVGSKVFMLKNGKILKVDIYENTSEELNSLEEYHLALQRGKEEDDKIDAIIAKLPKLGVLHILNFHTLPHGKDFFVYGEEMKKQLAFILGIEYHKLDNSLKSLKLVDRQIKKIDKNKLANEYFALIVAYISLVLEKEVYGTKEMREVNWGIPVWCPVILDEKKREYNPFQQFAEALESDFKFRLYDIVWLELNKYKIQTEIVDKLIER